MKFIENQIYHIYNQGNNKGQIFFTRENYLFFLAKFRKYVFPKVDVIAYCLMPSHFHFIVNTTKKSIAQKKVGQLTVSALANGYRLLLSTYAQAINKQQNRSGSLFRQKTKAKHLDNAEGNYPFICFQYIHQNPLRANLVDKMEDWEFSSFRDYTGKADIKLCNKSLAYELLDISPKSLYQQSYKTVDQKNIRKFLL